MGRSKRDSTWAKPRLTRWVWVELAKADKVHPLEDPVQGLVLAWRRHSYRWSALVVWVDDGRIVQEWIPAERLRPVRADPNR